MKPLRQGYYWARPLRSVGIVKEGQLQIVEVSECGDHVFTIGEEFSDPIQSFHLIAHIPRDSQQGIIRKLNEDLTYFRGENLRLLEQINQLKQAIAALNKEPTNSL